MKRNIAILLIGIFITSFSFAQEKKANAILKEVSEKTKAFETIKIQFNYKLDNEDADVHNEMKGVIITSENKFRLQLSGQLIINDGESVYTYIEEAEEIQIDNVSKDDSFINPISLITNYHEKYKAKYKKEDIINGRKMDIIELIPLKEEDKGDQEIFLTIDKSKKQIHNLKIIENKDSVITIEINEFITDMVLPEKTFIFDLKDYPDIDVNDMR